MSIYTRFAGVAAAALFHMGAALAGELSESPPACAPPKGIVIVSFTKVPASVRQDLVSRLGDIALPGQPLNPTDNVIIEEGKPTEPSSRILFVWTKGRQWLVATENGGFGSFYMVFAYNVAPDGMSATLIEKKFATRQDVCGLAALRALTF